MIKHSKKHDLIKFERDRNKMLFFRICHVTLQWSYRGGVRCRSVMDPETVTVHWQTFGAQQISCSGSSPALQHATDISHGQGVFKTKHLCAKLSDFASLWVSPSTEWSWAQLLSSQVPNLELAGALILPCCRTNRVKVRWENNWTNSKLTNHLCSGLWFSGKQSRS